MEALLFEASYAFIVNKNVSLRSASIALIRELNVDPSYHRYLLLCKLYVSLCQINKSVEVDYYKVRPRAAWMHASCMHACMQVA